MFIRIISLLAVLNVAGLLCLSAQEEMTQVEIIPEVRYRAKTFNRESDPIINPVPWVQFREMLSEGTRVAKGDVIFRLDMKVVMDKLHELEDKLEEEENNSAQRLAAMAKTVSQLEDQRAEKLDAKAIQVARRVYLTSLPVEADVEIAQGRLEVAQQNLSAMKEELRKSRERLSKKLISPAMFNEDEQNFVEQQARTRYAEQMLELTQQPANQLEIEIVGYNIRNLELEIEKLNGEIPTQKKILEIETATQNRRIQDLKSQLAERSDELNNEYLRSPANGVLMYSPQFKRELTLGSKASKGMELAEIPRRESMALEGVIPEQLRHLYKVGDPAEIKLNIFPDRRYQGKIITIAPFSRDAVEGDTSSGVKIVDLVVAMDEIPEELPLGVYGWVTLSTSSPVKGWAVPAAWIRYRGGKAHVSVNGHMEPVNGVLYEDQFVLSSPHPSVKAIQAEGVWSQLEDAGPQLSADQFIATGELTPFESLMLDTPRVRAWDIHVVWLVQENSEVKKGDSLVRLESEQLTKDLENREMDVKRLQGERESAEEELSIRVSEKAFQLGSAENRIEIKKRERDLVFNSGNTSEMLQTQMNLTLANIQLDKAKTELARSERNPEWTSETERKKRERDLERRKLEAERAQIRFDVSRKGVDDVERSKAELALLQEKAQTAELKAQHFRALSRAQSQLRWRKAREKNSIERSQRTQENIASMEITAPGSGLVKYLKVWDGVRQSKIKTGMKVWRGMQLLSLSSADKLYVEVSIPERYIQFLEPHMQVSVRIPSEGGMQWKGHIIQQEEILEPASQNVDTQSMYGNQEAPREQVLNIRILVDTDDGNSLKPGAIAQIIFPFEK